MAETTPFTIGTEVSCSDGACGELSRVVVDPVARAVTHLVVEPKHDPGFGRLVPLDLVDATAAGIRLRCTMAEFDKLGPAEETRFIPGGTGSVDYAEGEVLSWPYYGLGMGGGLVAPAGGLGVDMADIGQTVIYDKIPLGEVSVSRDQPVHATDGNIGRVQGLIIDPRDHHVTHVLLQEGHLWGRKEVAIPISAVSRVDNDGIQLSMAKAGVQDLPPVDIDHPGQ
jgi:sporulation protein YlmC with PRC-barrel domain